MFDIFSTREIATVLWLIIFIIWVFVNKETRKSAFDVIKIAGSKKLVIPFVCMLIYAITLSYLFSLTGMMKWVHIKEIAIWVLLVGVPTCFGAVDPKIDKDYFKKIVIDNLKLVILVEFIISTFTFNIFVEIILIPTLTLLFVLDAFAGTKEEWKAVKVFMSYLLTMIGLLILGVALKNAINDYSTLATVDTLVSFFIPLVFAILYLPVAYGFAIYAKYEMIFVRMSFKDTENKKIRMQHRRKVIKVCTSSYSKLCRFENECVNKMYTQMSEQEFDNIIRNFKRVKTRTAGM